MRARRIIRINITPCGCKHDGHPVLGSNFAFPRVRGRRIARAGGRIQCAVIIDILRISPTIKTRRLRIRMRCGWEVQSRRRNACTFPSWLWQPRNRQGSLTSVAGRLFLRLPARSLGTAPARTPAGTRAWFHPFTCFWMSPPAARANGHMPHPSKRSGVPTEPRPHHRHDRTGRPVCPMKGTRPGKRFLSDLPPHRNKRPRSRANPTIPVRQKHAKEKGVLSVDKMA